MFLKYPHSTCKIEDLFSVAMISNIDEIAIK